MLGVNCHHLAFTQENVDWQVWIQDGPQPFIRKFVITHKNEPGAPEFTALITHWDLTQRIADPTSRSSRRWSERNRNAPGPLKGGEGDHERSRPANQPEKQIGDCI